jgi:membrane-bound lytic murein transglycosylase D
MAITAYNHGLAGVRRAMREFGDDDALVDILRNYKGRTFGFASRNFYVAFLAAREIDRNPTQYFSKVNYADPIDYTLHSLPAYLSVEAIANVTGVSRELLAEHNPAWQPTIWQGSKHVPKGNVVRLPATATNRPLAEIFAAVGPDAWQDEQLPDMFHRIGRGETLSEIANTYKTSVSTLVSLNNLRSSNRIRAGQQLRLPAAGPAPSIDPPAATRNAAVEAAVVAANEPVAGPIAEIAPASLRDDGEGAQAQATELLSDPSDYSVRQDGTIEIHPQETLGHFADWLGIRTQRLRDINGLAFRAPVEVGQRLKLDLGRVNADQFEGKRVAYHRDEQDAFFRDHRISGVVEHTIRRGESIWILSLRNYSVPVWLFRQYNPELDLHRVQPGVVVQIPLLTDAVD